MPNAPVHTIENFVQAHENTNQGKGTSSNTSLSSHKPVFCSPAGHDYPFAVKPLKSHLNAFFCMPFMRSYFHPAYPYPLFCYHDNIALRQTKTELFRPFFWVAFGLLLDFQKESKRRGEADQKETKRKTGQKRGFAIKLRG